MRFRMMLVAALMIAVGCGRGPVLDSGGGGGSSTGSSPFSASPVKVGARVPAFELPDQEGRVVSASELAAAGGSVLLLVPAADAPAARPAFEWATRHRDLLRRDANAEVLVVAGSPVALNAEVARTGGLRFGVLADEEGALAGRLGLAGRLRRGEVWTVATGPDGRVHYVQQGLGNVAEVATALKARPGAPRESAIPVLR